MTDWIALLDKGGTVFALSLFLWGFHRGWWYIGPRPEPGVDSEWKDIALRAIKANEDLVQRQTRAQRRTDK